MKDTTSWVKEIVEGDGYVVIPGLLNAAQAENARSRVLQWGTVERQTGTLQQEGARERLYGLMYQGEIFEWMVQHPTVLEIVEAILGEVPILGGFSAHLLHPGATPMGVHVDYPYWAMQPPFPASPILEVQTIWMVEDFTEGNGAPCFAPGSQKLCRFPDLNHFENVARKVTGQAGTVVISHGLCWHDTSLNSTETPRVSILGNYTRKFVHPLEDLRYGMQTEVLDRATSKLKQLLRHHFKPASAPQFDL